MNNCNCGQPQGTSGHGQLGAVNVPTPMPKSAPVRDRLDQLIKAQYETYEYLLAIQYAVSGEECPIPCADLQLEKYCMEDLLNALAHRQIAINEIAANVRNGV